MGKTIRKNKVGKVFLDKDRKKGVIKVSSGCLSHGGCPYCLGNRLHSNMKRKLSADLEIQEEIHGKQHRVHRCLHR